jgi:hypothetical protein
MVRLVMYISLRVGVLLGVEVGPIQMQPTYPKMVVNMNSMEMSGSIVVDGRLLTMDLGKKSVYKKAV